MGNLITKPTELALAILKEYISEGDFAIDATAGNGHDTLALAKLVGSSGKVYAFDVQEAAIKNTKALLTKEGFFDVCILTEASHDRIKEFVPHMEWGRISAVVFNLGYLPGSGKEKATGVETTLPAVKQALELIQPDGLVAVTMYDGHEQGRLEKAELLDFAKALPPKEYHSVFISLINQQNNPPELLLITKK